LIVANSGRFPPWIKDYLSSLPGKTVGSEMGEAGREGWYQTIISLNILRGMGKLD
jgi:hypothetical protein